MSTTTVVFRTSLTWTITLDHLQYLPFRFPLIQICRLAIQSDAKLQWHSPGSYTLFNNTCIHCYRNQYCRPARCSKHGVDGMSSSPSNTYIPSECSSTDPSRHVQPKLGTSRCPCTNATGTHGSGQQKICATNIYSWGCCAKDGEIWHVTIGLV